MAQTDVTSGSSLNQRIYKMGLNHQAELASLYMNLLGEADDSAVRQIEDFSRQRGGSIQIPFSPTVTQTPFLEGAQIEGQEYALSFSLFTFNIGYAAFAYAQEGPMAQQRTNINLKKAALTKLPIQWERFLNTIGFNQAAAYTPANTSTSYSLCGFNAVSTVDELHVVRPADIAADETLTSANVMDLDLFDTAITRMKSIGVFDYPIPPTDSGYWYAVIHTDQARQLRVGVGETGWRDLQRAKLEGGLDYEGSELARGFLGVYNRVILIESDYIPKGVSSSVTTTAQANVRRAVLFGGGSCFHGFGESYTGGEHIDWVEQVRNYKRWGVMTDSVFGNKAAEWPDLSAVTRSYARLVLPTYSAI